MLARRSTLSQLVRDAVIPPRKSALAYKGASRLRRDRKVRVFEIEPTDARVATSFPALTWMNFIVRIVTGSSTCLTGRFDLRAHKQLSAALP